MPRYDKIPTHLTSEQRQALMQVPPDLSDREIARYYTFTEKERELINHRRRDSNRLGFVVQLALLRFPGRTLMEIKEVPRPVLTAIAEQLGVAASTFADYGERENTLYEHLDELRWECGFRSCGWKEYLLVARLLLIDAMESDRPLPLIETALERLRSEGIIAPNLIQVERLVWIVLKVAERRLFRLLTGSLSFFLLAVSAERIGKGIRSRTYFDDCCLLLLAHLDDPFCGFHCLAAFRHLAGLCTWRKTVAVVFAGTVMVSVNVPSRICQREATRHRGSGSVRRQR